MSDPDLDELAAELSEFAVKERAAARSPREERVIEGFEEVQRFVDQHGRAPQHGEDRDIFERLYAVRLDRLRALPDCCALLGVLDRQRLLVAPNAAVTGQPIDVDELASELADMTRSDDISVLRHVRANIEKRAAEEIAQRKPCADFEAFRPLFEQVQRELKQGVRETRAISRLDELKLTEIQQGEFYIVGAQLAYVAEVGEQIKTNYERRDSRLRVIYENCTESEVLQRSFQRALYRDEAARLVTSPSAGPLFAGEPTHDDRESGTIYVVRSKSDLPVVAAHRDVLHKIGVTGRSNLAARFSGARNDPTFLLADVEVVASYDLYNINRVKLENLIHRVFDPARLNIEIKDRFGKPVFPREWFLVPVFVIDEAVERIKDGSIARYIYDPQAVRLVNLGPVPGAPEASLPRTPTRAP